MTASGDMHVFVRVVERGSFSAAAEELGITPSAVSKLVTRLEDRLGARLLHRTTRRLSLTPEGQTYHQRARDILASIHDAEAEVSRTQTPQGRLRANSMVPFAVQLVSALPEFAVRYPNIELELTASDRVIDLIAENADVAIRTGPIRDTSLVARKLAEVHRHIYASPEYLKRNGTPIAPHELNDHRCITITSIAGAHRWLFREKRQVKFYDIDQRIAVDNSEAAMQMALAGGGIVRLGDIVAGDAVRDGRLVQLFGDIHVVEPVPISAVYPLGRQSMPKVRAFIDFLIEKFRHAPWRSIKSV